MRAIVPAFLIAVILAAVSPAVAGADPVVAAAGDIACGSATTDGLCGQQATAASRPTKRHAGPARN